MPTIPAPKPRWQRIFGTTPLYDILVALSALVGGLVAGILLLQGPGHLRRTGGLVTIVAAVAIAALNVVKAVLQWRQISARNSPHELEGCLYTLYDILRLSVPTDQAAPGLRITVHVPSSDGRNLVQAVDYVGSRRKTETAGRLIPISCGITGRAYRTKEPADLQRAGDNNEEYIRVLVATQGFTEDEARNVDHSTMSGYAAPLLFADGSVAGIVYADTIAPDFFNEEHLSIIDRACVGIARFVQRKYTV